MARRAFLRCGVPHNALPIAAPRHLTSSVNAAADQIWVQEANRLGEAALCGEGTGFEHLVWRLRSACLEKEESKALPRHDSVRGLAHRLHHAVLSGDSDSFDILLQRMRRLSPCVQTSTPATSSSAPAYSYSGVDISPDQLVWSNYPFNAGEVENAHTLRSFQEEFNSLVAASGGLRKTPGLLMATLDLAGAYIKNYNLDKADSLLSGVIDECKVQGGAWAVKCMQDLATLRFKQNRQAESAELLEELAASSPPHPVLQENLGTVYNSLGEHRRALECFERAVELKATSEKEDLWNIALARKNLGEVSSAINLLEDVLEMYLDSQATEHCPVTLAKVRDSLGECYLEADLADKATKEYREALRLYGDHVGKNSPLYGAAADGLSRSLMQSGCLEEAFEYLKLAFGVQASMDAIHPTPLYAQLERALELHEMGNDEDIQIDIAKLVPSVEIALSNLKRRGLDLDGDAGIVLQKCGQLLLTCADLEDTGLDASELRLRSLEILRRAKSLMDATMQSGEADLSELCVLCAVQIGLAEARLSEDGAF